MNHIPFNLERARAGDAIQTIEGHERRFIAYLPDRRHHLRVVVLDPKADRLYSHSESGEHCELVASLKLVMKPIQEPAATKRSTILPQDVLNTDFLERITALERVVMNKPIEPAAKVVRWLAVWETASGYYCSSTLFISADDAFKRALLACDDSLINRRPRAIKVEL